MFFALCASAQGASPTKQEIAGKCKILQNTIDFLKSKLVDIRKAEQDKILQQKQDTVVKQELLASNDSLLEKANQIVNIAQKCYEQDTTSNKVPLALDTVLEGLGAYVGVVFKEQEAKNIDVKEDFDKIINEQLTKFDYALQNLEKEMDDSNSDASGKEKNEENNSLDLLIILEIIGFAVILCVVCIIYLLAKSNSSRNKKPIICSIDYEWTVGIIQDKKVVYSGIAKRFFDVIPIGGPYLYINEEKAKYILESIQRYCHN